MGKYVGSRFRFDSRACIWVDTSKPLAGCTVAEFSFASSYEPATDRDIVNAFEGAVAHLNTLRARVEELEGGLEGASRMLRPLIGWNDRLKRGATSIPQTYENQIETVMAILDAAMKSDETEGE